MDFWRSLARISRVMHVTNEIVREIMYRKKAITTNRYNKNNYADMAAKKKSEIIDY